MFPYAAYTCGQINFTIKVLIPTIIENSIEPIFA